MNKLIRCIIASLALLWLAAPVAAQEYPNKPVRIIVPYPPGGATDAVARLMADRLAARWSSAVIVENKAGANGIIGTEILGQMPADGYTLGFIASPHVVNPALLKNMPFKLSDFTPVTIAVQTQIGVLVNPKLGVESVQELIALMKSRPGKLNAATGGRGSNNELWATAFEQITGTKVSMVPYKGSGAIYPDLIAGHVDLAFDGIAGPMANIKAGRIKLLAVGGARRSPFLPDVPTMVEAGVPGYVFSSWAGMIARAGTPAPIIAKLNADLLAILREPDTQQRLAQINAEVIGNSPAEAAAMVDAEAARMAKLVRDSGIEPQ